MRMPDRLRPQRLHRLRAQQCPQPGGDRAEFRNGDDLAVAFTRPAGLDHLQDPAGPRRHHRHPVRQHRRLIERVGDQQHRGPGGAPDPEKFVAHQKTGLLVERAKRLVEQNQPWLHHQRARDADTLTHAAGELGGKGVREILQAHQLQRVLQPPLDFRLIDRLPAQPEGDVVGDVEPGETGILLEHDADAVRHGVPDRPSLERHHALGWRRQRGDDVEQRRLAAAGWTDHGKELTPVAGRYRLVPGRASADQSLARDAW